MIREKPHLPLLDIRNEAILWSMEESSPTRVANSRPVHSELLSETKDNAVGWLKITAAKGLDIPYLGYIELDVEVMGMTLPECGFLIVKETPSPSSVAVLNGMNIISKCQQIVHTEFDTTLGGKLDSNWRVAFQQAQSVKLVERVSFARVTGKTPAHVFALDDDDLGYTDKVQHEIHLTDDVPVNRISLVREFDEPNQYQDFREHIIRLLKKGVIQESVSAYASPVVLVRKTDKLIKLNAKTRRDAFPLPRTDESFDALRGAKFFFTVDLASGYHQIAVSDGDRAKTAFTTPFGLFEYWRMPFVVCNGPSTVQRLMQAVMSDLIFQVLIVYLDDILLFSRTFEEHLERLEMVLKWLAETGLKVKLGKCCFLQVIRCQCRGFLLTLISQLKEKLTTAPVLGFADFSYPFILETDASQNGLGAIMYQKQGEEKRIIAYVITDNNPLCHLQTIKLGAVEQRWVAQLSVFNFEVKYRPGKSNAKADALSREEFAGELESDPEADWDECVTICSVVSRGTALGPALALKGVECTRLRQIRVLEAGEKTQTSLQGNTHTLPGYTREQMVEFQKSDHVLRKFRKYWEKKKRPAHPESKSLSKAVKCLLKQWSFIRERNGLQYRVIDRLSEESCWQLLLPVCLKEQVLRSVHDDMGHQGIEQTVGLLKQRCFWSSMQEWVKKCQGCILTMMPQPKVHAPVRAFLASRPLEVIAVDFTVLEPASDGRENVLVVTDVFTKFTQAFPTKRLIPQQRSQ
ncbi:hypothetical protein QQF64_025662 [Cirrhinus molitorella]|uniref:Gypsy retrotransposon integrase-like protein 1 n=1 Tax=Cirrhinus molitorella TaxID=172907 RepID=A0ABR3NPZ7_9TELE